MSSTQKKSVLFVCMGNICRSPTAEGVFRSHVVKNKLSETIITDSAGTHAYHIGNPPDPRAIVTAKNHGVDLSDLVARKVSAEDFNNFDYIIAMDRQNLRILKEIQDSLKSPVKASLHLFMEFATDWQEDEVPDPYYGGDNGFEEVYQMVDDASAGLLKQIMSS